MDRMVVEQRHPGPGQAVGVSQHPAGSRQRCRILRVHAEGQRLKQRRAATCAQCGPSVAGLHNRAVFVGNERQPSLLGHLPPESPVFGPELGLILVEEQDFHRVPAQQAGSERRRLPLVRVDAVEAQRGIVAMEGVIVCPGILLIVADDPEHALYLLTREMLDTPMKHGLLRLPGAGELQRMANTYIALTNEFKDIKQGGRLNIAFRQPTGDCGTVGDELGLPDDAVLAVHQVCPSGIGDEGSIFPELKNEGTGCFVVEVQPAGVPLTVGNVNLTLVIDFVPFAARISNLAHQARPCRCTKECHVLGSQRNGETIGAEHQVVKERLQSTVKEGRKIEISFVFGIFPKCVIDLDIQQYVGGFGLPFELPDIPEVGAILVRIPEDHLEAFVDLAVGHIWKGFVLGAIDFRTCLRRINFRPGVDQTYPSATMQLALRVNRVWQRRNLEGVFAG